ncbi:MAG: polar growth protein [Thelocarpon superellum]|nr:MAG: polar growth protein [Thelocarpon superellum]
MAMRSPADIPKKAAPGQILLVVHDFEARSSDELSLAKGDRIELIERDDDFGDGWYLGRHLLNGNTGLFPEVYTTSAPKGIALLASSANAKAPSTSAAQVGSVFKTTDPDAAKAPLVSPTSRIVAVAPTTTTTHDDELDERPSTESARSTPMTVQNITPPPTSLPPHDPPTPTMAPAFTALASSPTSNALRISSMSNARLLDEDSPVMNETLSVIEEHITDMSTPRHSLAVADRRGANDSGSEYSNHLDNRLSYITGHETDEEEENGRMEDDILHWSPARVAEYLSDVGVEASHCKVFVEQEISGEVLLGMDQASLLIKDLELGPVGRRLRTWHKIKALQDEAKGHEPAARGPTPFAGSGEAGAHDGSPRSRNSSGGAMLPRIPSLLSRAGTTRHDSRVERPQGIPHDLSSRSELSSPVLAFSPPLGLDSPTRPSAASIRDYNHARRHSSIDVALNKRPDPNKERAATYAPGPGTGSGPRPAGTTHRKQASFDRNWTMGNSPPTTGRPLSSTPRDSIGSQQALRSSGHSTTDSIPQESGFWSAMSRDLDRGYVSSGEFETRKPRKVIKKRVSAGHVRNTSSYTDEQRQRSATAHSRQSRYGSADSIRDPTRMAATRASATAAQFYQGFGLKDRASKTIKAEAPNFKSVSTVVTSPTVTRLDYDDGPVGVVSPDRRVSSGPAPVNGQGSSPASMAPPTAAATAARARATGLRAISDAVTGSEKASVRPGAPSVVTDNQSTTGSSKTTDADSSESTKASPTAGPGALAGNAGTVRRKAKQETSAYTRGLEKKTPAEQMAGCDYSGWMKKKSHKLMSTWKPRLFILRGRRLSYYYSEEDEQEKGLIDISSHRVLPADTDRIIGLHATLSGVSNSPTSPQNAQMPTLAATEAANTTPAVREGMDNIFIFKLVPPRLGLSKAVNFTKPTVHYFAVDNLQQGRLWMAALVKATIDRDDTQPLTTTNQQKTISLTKARQMRHRPPALMGVDEIIMNDRASTSSPSSDRTSGLPGRPGDSEGDAGEDDSGVSGMDKQSEEAKKTNSLDATSKTSLDEGK